LIEDKAVLSETKGFYSKQRVIFSGGFSKDFLDFFLQRNSAIPDPPGIVPFQNLILSKLRLFKTKLSSFNRFFEGIMSVDSLFCGVPVRICTLNFFPLMRAKVAQL
jgi:hypothetical protein